MLVTPPGGSYFRQLGWFPNLQKLYLSGKFKFKKKKLNYQLLYYIKGTKHHF